MNEAIEPDTAYLSNKEVASPVPCRDPKYPPDSKEPGTGTGEGAGQEPEGKRNPLLHAIAGVITRVEAFKARAKDFYFQVLLSQYRCPKCGSGLEMTGAMESECRCSGCGHVFDPTIEFQQSSCCGARLVKRTFHYACARCRRTGET
jgi:rubredoxin